MSLFQLLVSAFCLLLGVLGYFLKATLNSILKEMRELRMSIGTHNELFATYNVKMLAFEIEQTELKGRLRVVERTQDRCSNCFKHEDQ